MLKRENLNNGLDTRFTTCVNVRQLTSRDVVDTRNEKKRSLALVLLQIDDNQNITSGFPLFFPLAGPKRPPAKDETKNRFLYDHRFKRPKKFKKKRLFSFQVVVPFNIETIYLFPFFIPFSLVAAFRVRNIVHLTWNIVGPVRLGCRIPFCLFRPHV